jgi:hypothetical protein
VSGRPNGLVAREKRDELARLLAVDAMRGGLQEQHRNVVQHVKSVGMTPKRALKLSYEPEFVAQVAKLVRAANELA